MQYPATRPEPGLPTPKAVSYAGYLMWIGAVLQAAAAVTAVLTRGDDPAAAEVFGIFSPRRHTGS